MQNKKYFSQASADTSAVKSTAVLLLLLCQACGVEPAPGILKPSDDTQDMWHEGAGVATNDDSLEQKQKKLWHREIHRTGLPKKGCFEASFPDPAWKEVACEMPPLLPHFPRPRGPETIGSSSSDVIAGAQVASVQGFFSKVVGLSSVQDSKYGQGAYTLQINTNLFGSPSCQGTKTPESCVAWQQFVTRQSPPPGLTSLVFMQYWLLNYNSACPSASWMGFPDPNAKSPQHCFMNSQGTPVTDAQGNPSYVDVSRLAQAIMTGSTSSSGDAVKLSISDTKAIGVGQDSVLSLAGSWSISEFNIFGYGASSQLQVNDGTTLVVNVSSGSAANQPVPAFCGKHSFTGETNTLSLVGSCCPTSSGIRFVETNANPVPSLPLCVPLLESALAP